VTKKKSNVNSSRLDTEACRRCGRTKRASKLERSSIGMVCSSCNRAISQKEATRHDNESRRSVLDKHGDHEA
jgi:hypothetical protein